MKLSDVTTGPRLKSDSYQAFNSLDSEVVSKITYKIENKASKRALDIVSNKI